MAKLVKNFRDLKIEEFAHVGELSPELKGLTVAHLLEDCGNLLDHIESHEILCRPVFKLSDGKWYTVSVEAVISRADKETVEIAREEAGEESEMLAKMNAKTAETEEEKGK